MLNRMLLKISLFDAARYPRGSVRIKLNWGQKKWSLVEDDAQSNWQRVGFTKEGPFEPRPNGTIWFWDQEHIHNTVIAWNAPASEEVIKNNSGSGRIFEPKDALFKEGPIEWMLEGASPSVATPTLSPLREKALKTLDRILPAPYGSQNWKDNPYHSEMKEGAYTNCVEFPRYYLGLLGKKLYAGYPPKTTKGWTDADGIKRPGPGDVYILCATAKRDHTNAHVGIIYSTNWDNSNGLLWRTADWGQVGGWDGKMVVRTYDPVAASLTGEAGSPYPQARAIFGWVDLDKYFS
jgi:hypothetical protein